MQKDMVWIMDKEFMDKILREKEVRLDDLPDDFDIESLPSDVELIFEEHFPELEDEFWEVDDISGFYGKTKE